MEVLLLYDTKTKKDAKCHARRRLASWQWLRLGSPDKIGNLCCQGCDLGVRKVEIFFFLTGWAYKVISEELIVWYQMLQTVSWRTLSLIISPSGQFALPVMSMLDYGVSTSKWTKWRFFSLTPHEIGSRNESLMDLSLRWKWVLWRWFSRHRIYCGDLSLGLQHLCKSQAWPDISATPC